MNALLDCQSGEKELTVDGTVVTFRLEQWRPVIAGYAGAVQPVWILSAEAGGSKVLLQQPPRWSRIEGCPDEVLAELWRAVVE